MKLWNEIKTISTISANNTQNFSANETDSIWLFKDWLYWNFEHYKDMTWLLIFIVLHRRNNLLENNTMTLK